MRAVEGLQCLCWAISSQSHILITGSSFKFIMTLPPSLWFCTAIQLESWLSQLLSHWPQAWLLSSGRGGVGGFHQRHLLIVLRIFKTQREAKLGAGCLLWWALSWVLAVKGYLSPKPCQSLSLNTLGRSLVKFHCRGRQNFPFAVEMHSAKEKLSSFWAPNHDSFPKPGLLEIMCSIIKSSQQAIAQITASPARFSIFL